MADFDWGKDSVPAQDFDWERDTQAVDPSKADSFVRGGRQGASLGFADEDTALKAAVLGAGGDALSAIQEGRFSDLAALPGRAVEGYRAIRDVERRADEQARSANTKSFIGGEIVGGAPTVLLPGGAGRQALALAAGAGAAGATGRSEAETASGLAQDAALGGALGAAGQAIGSKVGEGLDAARQWVLRRAQQGKDAAATLAGAQAKDLIGKQVKQAQSAAGSAASNARNVMENVEGINLPVDNARRTVGEAREALLGQIDALDDALEAATARAQAMGVDPSSLSPGRVGEFLAKGSKLDKAQKAAKSIQALQAAREKLVGEYQGLGQRAVDELLPDEFGPLREAQAALRSDPRFEDLKQNVLKNSLRDFDSAAAKAVAEREAFQQALASQADDEAALAQRLLSGEEALSQVGQRVQRYAAPLAGSLLGGGIGAGVGLAVGNDPTDALLYGLGGAGARPAIQAVRRMAGHPSVQNAAWSGLERLAKMAPESFGRFSGPVSQAAARGPEALQALEKVLNDTSPEWRAMRERQKQDEAR